MFSRNKNNEKIVHLFLNTWTNDISGTYDYNNTSVNKLQTFISNSTYVVRTKYNKFKNINQHADIDTDEGEDIIFYVNNPKENTFFLINFIPKNLKHTFENFNLLNNKLWYVINNAKSETNQLNPNYNENYYLNENDIIKLGKVKFIVQKIHLSKKYNIIKEEEPATPVKEIQYNLSDLNKNTEPQFINIDIIDKYSGYIGNSELSNSGSNNSTDDGNENNECIFCNKNYINNEINDRDNFLISVCKCDQLVHFKCLKYRFIELLEKVEPNNKYVDSYILKDFKCPSCKSIYPTKFKLKDYDRIFYLIDILLPNDFNYLILESIDYTVNSEYYKCIYLVKFIKNEINIGRDSDNDVINKDGSMSRSHAILNFEENTGKICIQNLSKTYGTLVLVKKPIKLLDKNICLQVGRTFIKASLINREEYDQKQKDIDNEGK